MTDRGGTWEQQRLLWELGETFVEADADDLVETIEFALGRIAEFVGAVSAGIWRAVPPYYGASVLWRWVQSEGMDFGVGAATEANVHLVTALEEADGAAILPLEFVVGREVVADRGWSDGTVGVVIVEMNDDEVLTLVIASSDDSWGEPERLFFRGFGTLLRQFIARVRAQEELAYRLRLEDLVSSSVARLVALSPASWDGAVGSILEDIQRVFSASTVLFARADEYQFDVEHFVGLMPASFEHVKITGHLTLPERLGLTAGDPRPKVMELSEMVAAVYGPEALEAVELPTGVLAAIFPARVGDASHAVLTVLRETDGWKTEELDAVSAIASTVAQTRARFMAEEWSDYRLRIQQVFSATAARFLRADVLTTDAVIGEGLAEFGEKIGADLIQLVDLDDPVRHTARLAASWSRDPEIVFPADVRVAHPCSRFGRALYRGETARSVLPSGAARYPQLVELVGEPTDGLWSSIGAPILGRTDAPAAVILIWNGDHSQKFDAVEGLLTALADMVGQLRARVALELRTERQSAAQALLRECAVELAEAGDSSFDDAMKSVLTRVGAFLDLTEITNWRVDHNAECYVVRHRWSSQRRPPRQSDVSFGAAPALDQVRARSISVPPPTATSLEGNGGDGLGRAVVHARRDAGRVHGLLVAQPAPDQTVDRDGIELLDSLNRMMSQIEDRVAAERYSQNAFNAAPIGIVLRDQNLGFVTSNPAFLAFIGAESLDELVGTPPDEVLDDEFDEIEWSSDGDTYTAEVAFRRRLGGRVWGQLRVARIEGVITGESVWLVHVEDITERRRAEQLLRYQASHDELTGLANRRELMDETARALAGTESVAVLLLDLDRFKLINDSLGHDKGDELLVVIADRLRLAVRPGDLVARLGGDEFAVMLPGPTDIFEARHVAERLLELLGEPIQLGGQQVFPSASIGISVADRTATVPDLLRRADTAMYRAKSEGRARHETYDADLREEVMARMATEAGLRRALREGELCVHYQPELSLRDGRVLGGEALVRWHHPERGILAASEFIGVAEETGLVVEMGELVLEVACLEATSWPGGPHAGTVRVNMAAAQLQREETVAVVADVLSRTGLEPRRLCLEITESAVMANTARTEDILNSLKDLGVKLAVDDFGTGFSSLAYLKRFPVDAVKIDREFVVGLGGSDDNDAFVRSIVSLAEALGLDVVAEGVEEEAQAEALLRLGCHRAQGFLLGRPGPADVLRNRLTGIERGWQPSAATARSFPR